MGQNTDRRVIFMLSNEELSKLLDKIPIGERHAKAKQLFIAWIDGKQPTPELDAKRRIEKVKAAHLTLKMWMDAKKLGLSPEQLIQLIDGKLSPVDLPDQPVLPDQLTTEPQPASQTFGTVKRTPKSIIQSDGTLRCMRCNRKFPTRAFDYMQVNDYRKHVEQDHEAELTQVERDELMKVFPN